MESATFRVETVGLEWCLEKRPMMDIDLPVVEPGQMGWEFTFPMKTGCLYKSVSPEGGKHDADDGNRTWQYKNYKPGPPLRFIYYVVAIPRTAADCDRWVRRVLGDKPRKADAAELREIAAAFFGITPRSESAKKFAEQQVWYHPKTGLKEAELSEEQKSVLKRLDAIAPAALP
jgi:hypothetical protein